LPEEGEGHVQVLGFDAPQGGERRRQDLGSARSEVVRQRYRDEKAHPRDGTVEWAG
jgi:hypothetical protein